MTTVTATELNPARLARARRGRGSQGSLSPGTSLRLVGGFRVKSRFNLNGSGFSGSPSQAQPEPHWQCHRRHSLQAGRTVTVTGTDCDSSCRWQPRYFVVCHLVVRVTSQLDDHEKLPSCIWKPDRDPRLDNFPVFVYYDISRYTEYISRYTKTSFFIIVYLEIYDYERKLS